MQDNNINKTISNALQVDKDILSENIKSIIAQIQKALDNNKEFIEQANIIDKKNNNGFILDFNIIKNIFSNLEKENAPKFVKEVKSKIVTVNTSPTIERIIDIEQKDLINEKTIIYPFNF